MTKIIREGGALNVKQIDPNTIEANVSVPADADGRHARTCPNPTCSPGYFKVRLGTGIVGGQTQAFCPYCRHDAEPGDFITEEQKRYAIDSLMGHVADGFVDSLADSLGLGAGRKRRYGGGFLFIEMSFEKGRPPPVRLPLEEKVRRDLVCPHCGLDHSVYGLATWCADCGRDIFLEHVFAELRVVKTMLDDIPRREEMFGARVAGKDLENCLEDVVSIFEAVLRVLVRRTLCARGMPLADIEETFRKTIRNGFQSVGRTVELVQSLIALDLAQTVPAGDIGGLASIFEKRHPITHNLGVVDRKYLEKAHGAEAEGREITISAWEIERAMALSRDIFGALHALVVEGNA